MSFPTGPPRSSFRGHFYRIIKSRTSSVRKIGTLSSRYNILARLARDTEGHVPELDSSGACTGHHARNTMVRCGTGEVFSQGLRVRASTLYWAGIRDRRVTFAFMPPKHLSVVI